MPTTTVAGVNSHDIHANKSVTGANRPSFQLFGQLPFELRLQIWETASFDLPSRVCCLDQNMQEVHFIGTLSKYRWKNPSGLVVHDLPSLCHVCHESRQVALKYASTIGWTVSGGEPPYRYFGPSSDVLHVSVRKMESMDEVRPGQYPGIPKESSPVAVIRARQARHIVVSLRTFDMIHVGGMETCQV